MASQLTLCFHEKPIILWNMKGFWNSLITCLDDLHSRGVTRKQWRTYIQVADTLDDIKTMIAK